MITTKWERNIVHDLIRVLYDSIAAVGGCDHAVGICNCHEHRLREEAKELLNKNHMVLHGSGYVIEIPKGRKRRVTGSRRGSN